MKFCLLIIVFKLWVSLNWAFDNLGLENEDGQGMGTGFYTANEVCRMMSRNPLSSGSDELQITVYNANLGSSESIYAYQCTGGFYFSYVGGTQYLRYSANNAGVITCDAIEDVSGLEEYAQDVNMTSINSVLDGDDDSD